MNSKYKFIKIPLDSANGYHKLEIEVNKYITDGYIVTNMFPHICNGNTIAVCVGLIKTNNING